MYTLACIPYFGKYLVIVLLLPPFSITNIGAQEKSKLHRKLDTDETRLFSFLRDKTTTSRLALVSHLEMERGGER